VTTELNFTATVHQSGTIQPTTWSDTLTLEADGGLVVAEPPVVTQLTATSYLVAVTLENPLDVPITNGRFAIFGDLDVVNAATNFGEPYDSIRDGVQGLLFKYNAEVFWRFILRRTGDFVASGFWRIDGQHLEHEFDDLC
jgi:hypothetical protein